MATKKKTLSKKQRTKIAADKAKSKKTASKKKDAYLQTAQYHIKKGYTDSFEFYRLKLSDDSIKGMFLYDVGNNVFGLQVYGTTRNARLLYKKTEYGDCKVLNTKEIDKFLDEGKAQTPNGN